MLPRTILKSVSQLLTTPRSISGLSVTVNQSHSLITNHTFFTLTSSTDSSSSLSSTSSLTSSLHKPSWTPSSIITIPKRHMGIMDRLQSFASGKKQEVIDAKGGK